MAKPGAILRDARQRAGLSQRELARRAGTAQSVVARIETGLTSPSFQTLERLLAGAGMSLRAEVEAGPAMRSHMLEDIPRILALTPEERLIEVANLSRFEHAARRG